MANMYPADLAELLDDLPREDRVTSSRRFPSSRGGLLSELKGETLRLILHSASPAKLGPMLDRLPADEVTDLLEHLTSASANHPRQDVAAGRRRSRAAARYPPRTAAVS